MKNLIPIIGKAPSELDPTELAELISKERERAREAIMNFLTSPPSKPSASKKSSSRTTLLKQLKEAGVSIEDLEKMLEEQRDE